MIFTRVGRTQRPVSTFALAFALVTGGAVLATALEAPASAQREPKRKKNDEQAPQASYSKAFVELYQPLAADIEAGKTDAAALKARVPALLAAASSADEKLAGGQVAYNIGAKAEDVAMQREGLALMLGSGKVAPDRLGLTHYGAAQLAQAAQDFAAARTHFEQAAAAGYNVSDSQIMIAETHFAENNSAAGLEVLEKAFAAKRAAGEAIPENWLKRAVSVAYKAKLVEPAAQYAAQLVQTYPGGDAWADAINIQRNMIQFEDEEMLDLLRLAQRTSSLRSERDFSEYISVANPRRLPNEVSRVIEAGLAAGALQPNDTFVAEAKKVADGRVSSGRADLAGLERDARASGATAVTATAAGDMFLNYGEAAKAEEFYTIALGKPGADQGRVLTRLGIAQLDQGKSAEAQATFAKVQGTRQPIARLWAVYAAQKAG